jgi:hypothetical protein
MLRPVEVEVVTARESPVPLTREFNGHRFASMTLGTSSRPLASSNSTLTSRFSASRRATTEPEEPDPQTMKS